MSTPFAIVPYPLSGAYRAALERALGDEVEVLDVPTLRRVGPARLLRELHARRGRPCVLPLEDPASVPLLPVLELLAALARPSSIELVDPDLRRRRLSRLRAVTSAGRLARGTLVAQAAARAARAELTGLLASERSDARGGVRRVLHLNPSLWFGVKAGGSVGHVAGVVNALVDEAWEVDVAAVERPPLLRPAAGYVALPAPASFGLPSELNQYVFSRRSAALLTAHARRRGYGVVYQRHALGSYAGATIARALGVPLVLEYNGSEVWVARNWGRPLRDERLALAAEEASLRHAHVVVTISQVLGDELAARGVEPERLVVHPNGVDPELFDPERLTGERARIRRELAVPEHGVVVAFLGTFGRWHGAEVLARAARSLAEDDPAWVERAGVRFLFVGDGLRLPAVRETLGEAGAAVSTLTGLVPQRDAPAYLAASDVLVSPHVPNEDGTPFFGSPTKLFEYLAMGKAVVASELDQLGDVLTPALRAARPAGGGNGPGDPVAVLATPGSAEELAAAVRTLVDDPALRERLGLSARRLALSRYTWRHHVDAILDRLDELGLAAGANARPLPE